MQLSQSKQEFRGTDELKLVFGSLISVSRIGPSTGAMWKFFKMSILY